MHSKDPKREARDANVGALAALPSVVASEFVDWAPPWFRASSKPQGTGPAAGGSPLSEAERRYLQAVISSPGQTSSVYPPLAGMSARKALEARKHLVELGYIREHVVNTAGRGRPSIVLEPTAQAHEAMSREPEGKRP